MKRIQKFINIVIFSLMGLCVVLLAFSALDNLTLPYRSASVDVLSAADKTRLAETQHLRQNLGDEVWPGWGQTDIPMIVYNEESAFLVGFFNPPEGWVNVPAGIQHGQGWEPVADETFMGEQYYRQRLDGITPEAFTVMVGERWVCSLPTFDWMQISLRQSIRDDLPSFLQPVFPYRLFIRQLVGGDDQYISLNVHECFHAYQGLLAAGKLAAAENSNIQYESQYPWENEALQTDWQTELALLADALRMTDQDQSLELVRRFLEVRAARRDSANLSPELIAYEQKREWLEGLARYAELEIWHQASLGKYIPTPESVLLSDFEEYGNFDQRWSRELDQFSRMAGDEGDGRFYYTGMAQAYLLDRLMSDWKSHVFNEYIWLDDLLTTAVQSLE
ncbi:MAG: hypothetical protein IH588_13330 [Anaerolineales bacterium]|nr:hypothetical protein [Anaerolineales bacterium]